MYNLVFGQHPSKENLNKFFANPIIKILWQQQFLISQECRDFENEMRAFGTVGIKKFNKYFKKVEDKVGYKIYNY